MVLYRIFSVILHSKVEKMSKSLSVVMYILALFFLLKYVAPML